MSAHTRRDKSSETIGVVVAHVTQAMQGSSRKHECTQTKRQEQRDYRRRRRAHHTRPARRGCHKRSIGKRKPLPNTYWPAHWVFWSLTRVTGYQPTHWSLTYTQVTDPRTAWSLTRPLATDRSHWPTHWSLTYTLATDPTHRSPTHACTGR
jgi:hypothetical protein